MVEPITSIRGGDGRQRLGDGLFKSLPGPGLGRAMADSLNNPGAALVNAARRHQACSGAQQGPESLLVDIFGGTRRIIGCVTAFPRAVSIIAPIRARGLPTCVGPTKSGAA